jgi:DNA excision repair protein ERCC-2
MALSLSKLFMRTISQSSTENQTGVSLWTIEDVAKAQEKQRALALELEQQQREDEDEFDDGGIADHMLEDLDLDV